MKQLVIFTLIVIISCFWVVQSQQMKEYSIVFYPMLGNKPMRLNDSTSILNDVDIQIKTLKFYISGITFLHNNSIVWQEPNSFHLVDAANISSLQISLLPTSIIHFSQLQFTLGIDSATNASGAMGQDLDPTRGMYWTWQSGYINFKLEGKSPLCKTRNNEFQFHIGGYQFPFNSLRTVILDVSENPTVNINIELENLLKNIDLSQQNHIMSPSKEAVTIAEKISKIFIIQK